MSAKLVFTMRGIVHFLEAASRPRRASLMTVADVRRLLPGIDLRALNSPSRRLRYLASDLPLVKLGRCPIA